MEHSRRVGASYRSTGTSSGDSATQKACQCGGHKAFVVDRTPPLALFSAGTKSGDFSARSLFNLCLPLMVLKCNGYVRFALIARLGGMFRETVS